jgi:general secretion pathway protein A
VTLTALAARWQGDFATLWRAPPGYARSGSVNRETMDWIAGQLAQVNGSPAPAGRRASDAAVLKSQLRSFQLAHGLVADGQVGPMTYMQLNRVAGVQEPRLRTE